MYNKQDDTFALKLAKKIKIINLLGGECVKCKNKDINVLEFHHVDEDKIFEIGRKFGLTTEELYKEFRQRSKLLYELQKRSIFDFNQVQRIINEYHKNSKAVLDAFGIVSS